MARSLSELKQLQSLPYEAKLIRTKRKIKEWYEHWQGDVYVSVSGKDSTVVLDIVRKMYPDVVGVFIDTGLEYPEVRELAKSHDNMIILHTDKPFWKITQEYGYPLISKEVSECVANARACIDSDGKHYQQHYRKLKGIGEYASNSESNKTLFSLEKWKDLLDVPFRLSSRCCTFMKKTPLHSFSKESGLKAITGEMASESRLRIQNWLKNGCNGFDMKEPKSTPISFWTEQDVLRYIRENNVKIPSVYGDIIPQGELINGYEQLSFCNDVKYCTTKCQRTGCIYCGFGCHLEKGKTRFQLLKETHPKLYNYCMGGGEFDSDGMWIPNKQGLGLKFVFDTLNDIYGKDFIRYE